MRLILLSCLSLLAFSQSEPSITGPLTNNSLGQIASNILTGYDILTRPNIGSGPTSIQAQYRVNRLFGIDPKASEFNLDLFLRLQWNDPRLIFSASLGNESLRVQPEQVWVPDLYFYNENKKMEVLDQTLKISPDGTVFWSRHYIAALATPFQLQDFPFDAQTLKIQLVSYSNNENTMDVSFYPDSAGGPAFPDPTTTFSSTLWMLKSVQNSTGKIQFRTGTPQFDFLTYSLVVQRDSSTYVLKYVLPLFFIGLCSTLTYWIDPNAVPARVGFGVSLLLATITLNFIISNDLPKINYATAMDNYISVVFLFVFVAMVEFALIHYLNFETYKLLSQRIEKTFRILTPGLLILSTGFVCISSDPSNPGKIALLACLLIYGVFCVAIGIFLFCRENEQIEAKPLMVQFD